MLEEETSSRLKIKFILPNDEGFEISIHLTHDAKTNRYLKDLSKVLDRAGTEHLKLQPRDHG